MPRSLGQLQPKVVDTVDTVDTVDGFFTIWSIFCNGFFIFLLTYDIYIIYVINRAQRPISLSRHRPGRQAQGEQHGHHYRFRRCQQRTPHPPADRRQNRGNLRPQGQGRKNAPIVVFCLTASICMIYVLSQRAQSPQPLKPAPATQEAAWRTP